MTLCSVDTGMTSRKVNENTCYIETNDDCILLILNSIDDNHVLTKLKLCASLKRFDLFLTSLKHTDPKRGLNISDVILNIVKLSYYYLVDKEHLYNSTERIQLILVNHTCKEIVKYKGRRGWICSKITVLMCNGRWLISDRIEYIDDVNDVVGHEDYNYLYE